MLKIVDFTPDLLDEARALALAQYNEARMAAPALPEIDVIPDIEAFAENGMGVAALQDGRLAGYLSTCEPNAHAFGTSAYGVFSPIQAHAAAKENRRRIWGRLYQAAGEKWVRRGATYHCIALYACDADAQTALFMDAFGARCADAVRTTDSQGADTMPGFTFRQLEKRDEIQIRPLRTGLSVHLGAAPCFMRSEPGDCERWIERAETRKSRVFAAFDGEKPAAFYEVTDDGENFATEDKSMLNICGAYCDPAYRGTGLASALLEHVASCLRREGVPRLGVDFETMNPTANAFWRKSFDVYTHSVTRRLDIAGKPEDGVEN